MNRLRSVESLPAALSQGNPESACDRNSLWKVRLAMRVSFEIPFVAPILLYLFVRLRQRAPFCKVGPDVCHRFSLSPSFSRLSEQTVTGHSPFSFCRYLQPKSSSPSRPVQIIPAKSSRKNPLCCRRCSDTTCVPSQNFAHTSNGSAPQYHVDASDSPTALGPLA